MSKFAIIFALVLVFGVSISVTAISAQSQNSIPSWVKTNALWWGQEQIPDSDYLAGLQYLIDNNLIQVSGTVDPAYVTQLEDRLEESERLNQVYEKEISSLSEENKKLQTQLNEKKVLQNQEYSKPQYSEDFPSQSCHGNAGCITGHVTKVIDGDTIEVDRFSVRLVLVDTPEYGERGYEEAGNYIKSICPVGSPVLIDVDDLQERDRYGRILGVVYCGEWNLNRAILASGWAEVYERYCSESEFGDSSWVSRYGCDSSKETSSQSTSGQSDCDPSYPDFCIPSPPPDLDCRDISQKRFTVLQPDPHRFDGDKDGIGCES